VPHRLDPFYFDGYFNGDRPRNFRFTPEDKRRIRGEIEEEIPLTQQLAGLELTKPLMFIYSGMDAVVPEQDSLTVIEALRGIAVDDSLIEVVNFANQTHKMDNLQEVGLYIANFLNQRLGYAEPRTTELMLGSESSATSLTI
jgi:hypothetical protein